MSNETTVLTDEQIAGILHKTPLAPKPSHHIVFARAIEKAVQQSPEVQAWKKNAERWQFFIDNYDEYGAVGYIDAANFKAGIYAAMEKQP